MTKWLSIFLHSFVSLFRARRDLALQKLLLRQQLAVLKERGNRPQLSQTDRSFWVLVSRLWPKWRHVLHVVKLDAVIRWHREGSRRSCSGVPGSTDRRSGRRLTGDQLGAHQLSLVTLFIQLCQLGPEELRLGPDYLLSQHIPDDESEDGGVVALFDDLAWVQWHTPWLDGDAKVQGHFATYVQFQPKP